MRKSDCPYTLSIARRFFNSPTLESYVKFNEFIDTEKRLKMAQKRYFNENSKNKKDLCEKKCSKKSQVTICRLRIIGSSKKMRMLKEETKKLCRL